MKIKTVEKIFGYCVQVCIWMVVIFGVIIGFLAIIGTQFLLDEKPTTFDDIPIFGFDLLRIILIIWPTLLLVILIGSLCGKFTFDFFRSKKKNE